jgi:uncharacterized protein CbrC (UPF0167 family)
MIAAVADLPAFRYHPDPLTTGSVREGDGPCDVCGRVRGFVYVGPVYSALADTPTICPWCLADGSASVRLEAAFTDVYGDRPDDVPAAVVDEIAHRTPGFSGWQQERWLYHCGDGAAFLGPVGRTELEQLDEASDVLRAGLSEDGWEAIDVDEYLSALSKTGSPTAYLFRCLVCGSHLAYSDSD